MLRHSGDKFESRHIHTLNNMNNTIHLKYSTRMVTSTILTHIQLTVLLIVHNDVTWWMFWVIWQTHSFRINSRLFLFFQVGVTLPWCGASFDIWSLRPACIVCPVLPHICGNHNHLIPVECRRVNFSDSFRIYQILRGEGSIYLYIFHSSRWESLAMSWSWWWLCHKRTCRPPPTCTSSTWPLPTSSCV